MARHARERGSARGAQLRAPLPRWRRPADGGRRDCGRPGSHGGRLDHRELDQQLPHARADPSPLARGTRSRGTRSRRPRAVVRADRAAPADRAVEHPQLQQRTARARRRAARLVPRCHPAQRARLREPRLLRPRLPNRRKQSMDRTRFPTPSRTAPRSSPACAPSGSLSTATASSPSRASLSTSAASGPPAGGCGCVRRGGGRGGGPPEPALLLRSKLPDPHARLGKRTFLQTHNYSLAFLPERVEPFSGAPQSVYADHFTWRDGVTAARASTSRSRARSPS